ncbi:MurR/RpiR family transcriptional regulator [Oceanomicrobium pacificus]|uniref:SIS domain-containing protein n=1 Tax=Oceanomicrobium pacificus TaxID=2692916 RepID=A0A6B0TPX3_9RHOB|nr:MurR/RpiR family transcriptional regulator [Oceanomicrobium pacificus]MXU66720.1 SIS domain-containing protein [Oceanomicrobium pacificus]
MTDLLAALDRQMPDLPPAEQALAALVASEPDWAASVPITELAARAGVSPPTVTRFCRRLGIDSFARFRVALTQAGRPGLRYRQPLGGAHAGADASAAALLDGASRAMSDALDGRDRAGFDAAVAAVASAGRILVFGQGGHSSLLAREAENRLYRLGLAATATVDGGRALMQAATLGKGDACLVISQAGRSPATLDCMAAARDYGATGIALTRPGSPLAELADRVIGLSLDEHDDILRPSAARYGGLILLDLLATEVAARIGDPARETMRRIKHQMLTVGLAPPDGPLGD